VDVVRRELLWVSPRKKAYKTVVDIDAITEIREGWSTPM
jgi:hypothetical protein